MDSFSDNSFNQNQNNAYNLAQNIVGTKISNQEQRMQRIESKPGVNILDDSGLVREGRGNLVGEINKIWKGEEVNMGVNRGIIEEKTEEVDNYNFNQAGRVISDKKVKYKGKVMSSIFKILIIILLPIGILVSLGSIFMQSIKKDEYKEEKGILVSVPMENVNWKDIGSVFEPIIEVPVKTESGYQKWEFLIDSGAVISSLPREWAEKTGKDIDMMKRSTFKGFGGVTSFAYQGEMTVLLGEEEVDLPVVFTEASSTKSLLGRSGFFQNYSVYFNHKDKMIEIRK